MKAMVGNGCQVGGGIAMGSLAEAGVVVGIVLGLFGSVFSVVQFFYGRKRDRHADAQRKRDLEREELKEKQREKQEESRAREAERKERMEDMKLIFLDKDIPRKTREPFFEEFVRLGGNGLYARMWLEEGAKLGEV
jgi:hypothetical protein